MSTVQADSLIKPVSLEEVKNAIKQLKSNKAPGPDRLTIEFYRIVGSKLENILVAVFKSSWMEMSLPYTSIQPY